MTEFIPGELWVESEAPNAVFVPKAREDLDPFWTERFWVVPFSAGVGLGRIWAFAAMGESSARSANA
jgi:hypothetical protein